jgi:GT2 family glycosyltransferase
MACKGEWIKVIAGDDILMESCIIDNVDYIKKNQNISILFSASVPFTNKDELLSYSFSNYDIIIPKEFTLSAKEQFSILCHKNFYIQSPTSFIKRELFLTYGYFDEKIPFMEDFPMWIKLTKNDIKLYFMPKYTVFYNKNDTISSSRYKFYDERFWLSGKKFRKMLRQDSSILLPYRVKISHSLMDLEYFIITKIFYNKRNKVTKLISYMCSRFRRIVLWNVFVQKKGTNFH